MKRTINYIVGEYGCHSAKYCVVLHEDHKIIGNINFEERCTTEDALRARINQLQQPKSTSLLSEDLMATRGVFTNQTLGKEAKKVRNTCAQPFSRRSAVKFCPLTCSYGLILKSRAGYQALVSYTYRFIFSIDWFWRSHATVDLCLKHKHKSRFSWCHGSWAGPLHLPSCWRTQAFPSYFKLLNSLSRIIKRLCSFYIRYQNEKNMSH